MREFGDRFRDVFSDLKNKEIAELLEVSPPAVQNYLGGRVPEIDVLKRISKARDVSLHWLLTGEGSRSVNDEKQPENEQVADETPMIFNQQAFIEIVKGVVNDALDERLGQPEFPDNVGAMQPADIMIAPSLGRVNEDETAEVKRRRKA